MSGEGPWALAPSSAPCPIHADFWGSELCPCPAVPALGSDEVPCGWVDAGVDHGSKQGVSDLIGKKNPLEAECTPRSFPVPLLRGGPL